VPADVLGPGSKNPLESRKNSGYLHPVLLRGKIILLQQIAEQQENVQLLSGVIDAGQRRGEYSCFNLMARWP
jgi:hypothetical protein